MPYSKCGENFILVTLSWICYSIKGDRPFVHGQPNTHWRVSRVVEWPKYQKIMEAQTVKMEDQKLMIKIVSSIAQATAIAMSEIIIECDTLKLKKAHPSSNGSFLHADSLIQSRTGSLSKPNDDYTDCIFVDE